VRARERRLSERHQHPLDGGGSGARRRGRSGASRPRCGDRSGRDRGGAVGGRGDGGGGGGEGWEGVCCWEGLFSFPSLPPGLRLAAGTRGLRDGK